LDERPARVLVLGFGEECAARREFSLKSGVKPRSERRDTAAKQIAPPARFLVVEANLADYVPPP
jgi:hypothetical protein